MSEGAIDIVGLVTARVVDAYRLARAILLDDAEAEDAVQELVTRGPPQRNRMNGRDGLSHLW